MAASTKWFGQFFVNLFKGDLDFDVDTFKISLHTSSWTPDQDADNDWADVDNEVSGTGYTHEGATLASISVSYDSGTNILKFDVADVTWSSATITARYAVIYQREAADADSLLVCYMDFGEDVVAVSADFKITINADGVAKITVS